MATAGVVWRSVVCFSKCRCDRLLTFCAQKRGKKSQSQSIAMGQQVLQSLVSQADSRRGGGSTAGLPGAQQQAHGQGSQTADALLGLGGGPGGFDISRMFQQMMPVVSQALGMGPGAPSPGVEAKSQAPRGDSHSPSGHQSSEDLSQVRDSCSGLVFIMFPCHSGFGAQLRISRKILSLSLFPWCML